MIGYRYKLKKEHLSELRKAHGLSFDSAEELLKHVKKPFVVVGDRASYNILKAGGTPDLIIHDLREKRGEIDQETFDVIYGFVAPELVVENPKGTITDDLWNAIKVALKTPPHRIRVIGEEDLAVMVACVQLPTGASIVYGFEDKIVLMEVDSKKREVAREILG
jgi:uncharacterized protein (UPF0218 family)